MKHDNTPWLEALTPEAEEALGAERIQITHLPYRVGRESRVKVSRDGVTVMERRKTGVRPSNDLYLHDRGRYLNVSRAHFQIERDGEGFRLVDRGSALGTYVGGNRVGGNDAGGVAALHAGEVIVVGSSESPFVFRFVTGA